VPFHQRAGTALLEARPKLVHRRRRLGGVDSRKIALAAYRVMAYVTGTGLIVLVCVAMPIKYLGHDARPVAVVGAMHGFFYMAYVVCSLVLAERCRWRPVRALLVMLAGTIPFVSFYAERKVTKLVRALPPLPPSAKRARPGRSALKPEGAADQQSDLHA
jgi:integral membrane protein